MENFTPWCRDSVTWGEAADLPAQRVSVLTLYYRDLFMSAPVQLPFNATNRNTNLREGDAVEL